MSQVSKKLLIYKEQGAGGVISASFALTSVEALNHM